MQRNSTWGLWWNKRSLKLLHFTNQTIESKEAMWIQDNCSIFEKSSADKNSHSSVSDRMKNLYSLLLILTLIKKVYVEKVQCGWRIFPGNTFLRSSEQTPLQWLIICCGVYFLSFSFMHESTETEEHFWEIHNWCWDVFRTPSDIKDFWLSSKYTSVMGIIIWK